MVVRLPASFLKACCGKTGVTAQAVAHQHHGWLLADVLRQAERADEIEHPRRQRRTGRASRAWSCQRPHDHGDGAALAVEIGHRHGGMRLPSPCRRSITESGWAGGGAEATSGARSPQEVIARRTVRGERCAYSFPARSGARPEFSNGELVPSCLQYGGGNFTGDTVVESTLAVARTVFGEMRSRPRHSGGPPGIACTNNSGAGVGAVIVIAESRRADRLRGAARPLLPASAGSRSIAARASLAVARQPSAAGTTTATVSHSPCASVNRRAPSDRTARPPAGVPPGLADLDARIQRDQMPARRVAVVGGAAKRSLFDHHVTAAAQLQAVAIAGAAHSLWLQNTRVSRYRLRLKRGGLSGVSRLATWPSQGMSAGQLAAHRDLSAPGRLANVAAPTRRLPSVCTVIASSAAIAVDRPAARGVPRPRRRLRQVGAAGPGCALGSASARASFPDARRAQRARAARSYRIFPCCKARLSRRPFGIGAARRCDRG